MLTGALRVNPLQQGELVGAMRRALAMTPSERSARHRRDWAYVVSSTTGDWAERVLMDLKRARERRDEHDHRAEPPARGEGLFKQGFGRGLGFRSLGLGADFDFLDSQRVVTAYRSSFRRLLIFDFEGTLAEHDTDTTAPSRAFRTWMPMARPRWRCRRAARCVCASSSSRRIGRSSARASST